MDTYKKISDKEVEITTVESLSSVKITTIDNLIKDKSALEQTIINNYNDALKIRNELLAKIAVIETRITEAKELGVKTQEEWIIDNPIIE